MSVFTGPVQEELVKLRDEGKIRAVGASIHNRTRAGKLAGNSILDLLMIRYNAAHPGAEQDIFPHLPIPRPPRPLHPPPPRERSSTSPRPPRSAAPVVAYTATAWRRLFRAPRGWKGRVATAGDCHRFCLANPHVDVVLTGPRNVAELRENLAAIERGPLSSEEMVFLREFGRAVHG